MVTFNEISKPLIDIELYGADSNISPIDKVHIMDEDTFEQFIAEWLYGCKNTQYSSIKRLGGAGDKGRDVVAYYEDGTVDYYQCKHYNNPLLPTEFYLELGKLCYYTYINEIPLPKTYYIVASKDVGRSLQDMIDTKGSLLSHLLDNWEKYCRTKITKTKKIELDDSLKEYILNFDFTIIKTYSIANIIDEHLRTIYGNIRFGGSKVEVPKQISPPKIIDNEEMRYIEALLEAYSDHLKEEINTVDMLKDYNKYFEHLNRQRKEYYSAETIRRFVRDTFVDSKQFEVLKDEVYDGIIDVHEKDYDSGYLRLVADLEKVCDISISKCLLDSRLHCIGNSERKGTCHMLVNDNRIRWVEEND